MPSRTLLTSLVSAMILCFCPTAGAQKVSRQGSRASVSRAARSVARQPVQRVPVQRVPVRSTQPRTVNRTPRTVNYGPTSVGPIKSIQPASSAKSSNSANSSRQGYSMRSNPRQGYSMSSVSRPATINTGPKTIAPRSDNRAYGASQRARPVNSPNIGSTSGNREARPRPVNPPINRGGHSVDHRNGGGGHNHSHSGRGYCHDHGWFGYPVGWVLPPPPVYYVCTCGCQGYWVRDRFSPGHVPCAYGYGAPYYYDSTYRYGGSVQVYGSVGFGNGGTHGYIGGSVGF